jgi:branched-chain amino acid transport system substrate-binding protein
MTKNERGVQVAQELINKEKVVATVGYINTGVALASQRFYQEAKIPVMNNVATGSVITKQFLSLSIKKTTFSVFQQMTQFSLR